MRLDPWGKLDYVVLFSFEVFCCFEGEQSSYTSHTNSVFLLAWDTYLEKLDM